MPLISIVMPVYNVEKYLRQSLESLVNQTLKDIEIIVVDDGSPDESYKIYQDYAKKDSRVKFVKKKNGGVSKARNTGLEAATGDFLLFVDSDDWMPENACEILYKEAVESNADLTVADVIMAHENGANERVHVFDKSFRTTDKGFLQGYKKAIMGYVYNPRPYGGRCIMPTGLGGPWNKLIKREYIERYHIRYDPYVMGIYDDCLFSLEVLAHAKSVAYIAEPVYFYRMVESSLLHKYKANMLEVNSRIFQRLEEYINKYENWNEYKKAFSFYVVRRFEESLKLYFFSKSNPKGFRDKLDEVRRIISSEPYKEAFQDVDLEVLNKSRRGVAKAARRGDAFGVWVIYWLKQLKLKITKDS